MYICIEGGVIISSFPIRLVSKFEELKCEFWKWNIEMTQKINLLPFMEKIEETIQINFRVLWRVVGVLYLRIERNPQDSFIKSQADQL